MYPSMSFSLFVWGLSRHNHSIIPATAVQAKAPHPQVMRASQNTPWLLCTCAFQAHIMPSINVSLIQLMSPVPPSRLSFAGATRMSAPLSNPPATVRLGRGRTCPMRTGPSSWWWRLQLKRQLRQRRQRAGRQPVSVRDKAHIHALVRVLHVCIAQWNVGNK